MWRDKSPGVKILWLWTFGTAAVLVANVMRTRIRDMEQLINAQDQASHTTDSLSDEKNSWDSAEVIEEKS
ncbi:hypothetical protein CDL12_14493 [Olea europaea subsp. europaea]|uniref:Uncharacterized protein n=1 Tax=Olea europaea subsp. europaea TaxID=158383 RepID=A0A8S0SAJ0_OLEEU|nr:hypothetical protein CDL12_14493 [Olea europaea subsp. europaea]